MHTGEHQLRQEIVKIGRLMYDKGFVSANDGNLSVRLDRGRFLITPSGLHKGLLEPDQLLVVDEEGQPSGPRTVASRSLKPTSELPMHLEAYRRRPDIQAVVHAHPPLTIALSIAGIKMDACLLPEAIVMLGIIPTAPYSTPSSEENAQAIRELITRHDAIVLERHGTLTVGDSLLEAFMRLETVEQNARIGFMLAQLGVRNPLPPDQVDKLLAMREIMGLSRAGERAAFAAQCGMSRNNTTSQELLDIQALVSEAVHRALADQDKSY